MDSDNENNAEDNLCLLCLDHHDQYDTRTSQSKNLTGRELLAYRSELYEELSVAFATQVHFGQATRPKDDPYAGKYINDDYEPDVSELELIPLPDGLEGTPRYAVVGVALFGAHREFGPNMGEMSVIGSVVDGVFLYDELDTHYGNDGPYTLRIAFDATGLEVHEEHWFGRYGMNVSFNGRYKRA